MSLSARTDGIFVALWSPINDGGHIDIDLLASQFEFLKKHPVHGIMALGSTGQFLHLTLDSRKRLLEEVVSAHLGVPVLANVSDIRPRDAIELGRFARGLGVSAISLLAPSFFPMHQDDIAEYFIRVAECVELPLALYNFPERTGLKLNLETIEAVARRVPVYAVKQSGAEFSYHRELAELGKRLHFTVFTGADSRLKQAFSLGAVGGVSGLANAVPELVMEAYEEACQGQEGRGAQRLNEIVAILSPLAFPLDVAAIMEARGLKTGAPKTFLAESTKARMAAVIAQLKLKFKEWGLS